ncbi:hypothetical protein IQ241_10210 [Romeria aff. gracilis LEGE 07310]|uniref:Uncharacterized protein n=1 Tax=Vasconcelosia minhoensis LEGE 07310 TaxID=915328 RepID=A0A8J7A7W7_9CYAN|nr:hypothetical protein [Romeria gracilis]MBE9077665.1 hypothetical protein [Romeria aff. gracilis LEGE 07310]
MAQLGRVYAALNPQLKEKPAEGGSAPPPLPPEKPDALLLTTTYSYLAEDYVAIESRLKQLGYNVITKNSGDFTQADVDGMELIVAADYSGPIKLDFAGLEMPVVVLDNRKLDPLALAAASKAVVSGPVWIDAPGYLTTERFMGELVLSKEDVLDRTMTLLNPTTLDLNVGVKSFLGGLSYSPIYASVQEGSLLSGQASDGRRVAFIGFVDSFAYLNDAGLQAFDAGVKWSANLKEPEEPNEPKVPEVPSGGTDTEFDYNFFLSTLWRSEGKEAFDKATAELDTLLDEFNSSDEIVEWLNFEQILLNALGQDAETKEAFSDEKVAVRYADWAVLYSQAKLQEKPYVIANDIGLFDDLWNARNSSFGENLQVSISEMLKQSVEIAQSIIPQPDPTACAFIDCSDTEVPRVVQDIGIGVAAFLITIPFPVVGVVLGGLSAGLNIGQAITGEDLAGNELTLRERIEKATTGVAEGTLELIALSEGRRLFSSVVERLRGLSRTGELTEETASIAVRDALSRVDDILGYPTRSLGAEFNNLEVVLRADPELVTDLGQRIGTNRFSAGDIARIRRAPEGVAPESGIVFLEIGTTRAEARALGREGGAGLRHILEEHARDFANANPPIPVEKIPDAVMVAVTEGQVVGRQGASRNIYEFFFEGRRHRMAVEVGSNGFIVGANPRELP